VKRETNSWRYRLLMAGYLFAAGVHRGRSSLPRRERVFPEVPVMWQAVIVGLIVLAATTLRRVALLARGIAAQAGPAPGLATGAARRRTRVAAPVRGRHRGQRAAARRRLQRLQRGAGGADPAEGPQQDLNFARRGRATAVGRHRFR